MLEGCQLFLVASEALCRIIMGTRYSDFSYQFQYLGTQVDATITLENAPPSSPAASAQTPSSTIFTGLKFHVDGYSCALQMAVSQKAAMKLLCTHRFEN